MIKVGPYGNWSAKPSGVYWNEQGKPGLSRIYIASGESVYSLQTGYVEGTSFELSQMHGGSGSVSGGGGFKSINLDYPSECLTSISGFFNCNGIRSITFGTNRNTYGPYGSKKNQDCQAFEMTFLPGEFFGFHGYSDYYCLRGIGVYLKPFVPPIIKSEQLG